MWASLVECGDDVAELVQRPVDVVGFTQLVALHLALADVFTPG